MLMIKSMLRRTLNGICKDQKESNTNNYPTNNYAHTLHAYINARKYKLMHTPLQNNTNPCSTHVKYPSMHITIQHLIKPIERITVLTTSRQYAMHPIMIHVVDTM